MCTRYLIYALSNPHRNLGVRQALSFPFSTEVDEAKFITLSDRVAKMGFRPSVGLVSDMSPDPGQ